MATGGAKPVLLITSAGSLVAAAILACLEPVRDALTIVGVNSVPAPVAFLCDRLHLVPPAADRAACEAAMRKVAALERPHLVLAGRDEDVALLADAAAEGWFPEGLFPAAVIPGPPQSLAAVFVDKLRTAQFARTHGLEFASTAVGTGDAAALAGSHGWPLIAKPRSGAGSRGVALLRNRQELVQAAADPRQMIQPFLVCDDIAVQWRLYDETAARGMPWRWAFTDIETTAELVIGPDGSVSGLCLDTGMTAPPLRTQVSLLDDREVAGVGLAWAAALAARGHRGPVNIQGKRLANGRFIPYEIGARFGGTSIARAKLGSNLVLRMVTELLGLPWPDLSCGRHWQAVCLETRRLSIPLSWYEELAAARNWHAPAAGTGAAGFRSLRQTDGTDEAGPGGIWLDKAVLADWARRHGLPFAATADTAGTAADLFRQAGFPLIAKPRRGEGSPHLLQGWAEVDAAFGPAAAATPVVVQPCLDAASLHAQSSAWQGRTGAPWQWSVIDTIEVVEGTVGRDGSTDCPRVVICVQRGGEPSEIRPLVPTGGPQQQVFRAFAAWAAQLADAGYRGGLRLSGKRDGRGVWVPFSASGRLLHLPEPGRIESRIAIPV